MLYEELSVAIMHLLREELGTREYTLLLEDNSVLDRSRVVPYSTFNTLSGDVGTTRVSY